MVHLLDEIKAKRVFVWKNNTKLYYDTVWEREHLLAIDGKLAHGTEMVLRTQKWRWLLLLLSVSNQNL